MEDRVIPGTDDGVKIAGRAAVSSGVAFAGNADALAVAGAGLDADFEGLGMCDCTFPVACRARRQILPGAVTARTLNVELHAPAGLCDLSGAVAFGTFAGRFERALAMAS